jgi:hypothetical protein
MGVDVGTGVDVAFTVVLVEVGIGVGDAVGLGVGIKVALGSASVQSLLMPQSLLAAEAKGRNKKTANRVAPISFLFCKAIK